MVTEALSKNLDSPLLHLAVYQIAFLENDPAGMAKEVAWGKGQPGVEDTFLHNEAGTAAYFGRMAKSRDFARRAADSAIAVGEKETAAEYLGSTAIRDAFAGDSANARKAAAAALALSNGRDTQPLVALTDAATNDPTHAQSLADDLAKRFPQDTIVQAIYLPLIRAQIAMSRNDPAKAAELLAPHKEYDLSQWQMPLATIYVRGMSLLAQKKGREARAEFQKVLDGRGVAPNEIIPTLAQLGIARAYALSGDTSKARTAYQDFLAIWKDADPDLPILQQAKSEYAKLQ